MKLTFISDTHSLHSLLTLGTGDVLVHCGDFTGRGSLEDTLAFAQFMAKQNFTHKIVIAGNHDWCFEDQRRQEAESILNDHGIIYLNDSGIVLDGVTFWGSPIQPEFNDWAFNRQRGAPIRQHWDRIPAETDVLITHGPAFGILDWCTHGARVGCEDLLEIIQRIQPKIHACGHIHESYGIREQGGTTFINACILNEYYRVVNLPIEYTLVGENL
ncbi:metallophosphatase domain-containing protein [Thiothrix lacustris]|jgi:Icc-related predicted phosphoesterase|uniref:metallophosphatase domain-containing protein n=1 Tax=Thiothrix lacustris TaxID=525917 RepID=UPI0027E47EFB|nr:metallophosphatase domain-containing protein [Thiothrix lacustris]WMP16744.1 metallophosphatase domain-containing protein [Thiothrix lacustris]